MGFRRAGLGSPLTPILLLLLVGRTPSSSAQEPRVVALRPLEGHVRLTAEGEREQSSSSTDTLAFREEVGLSTGGFIVDPRLAEFRLGGTVGLFQEFVRGGTAAGETEGILTGYTAETTLLRGQGYPLTLVAQRAEERADLLFEGRSTRRREAYAATLLLSWLPVSSTLHAVREHPEETTRFRGTETRRDEIRTEVSYTGRRQEEFSSWDLGYDHTEVTDRIRPEARTRADSAQAAYRIHFGEEKTHTFGGQTFFRHRDDGRETLDYGAGTDLSVRHARNLSSDYRYRFSSFETEGLATRSHAGSASVRHQLYGSLTTSGGITGSFTTFSPGQESQYGGDVGLGYTKRILGSGRLTAGYHFSGSLTDRDATPSVRLVLDERHTLTGVTPVTLLNPRVLPGSIVVRDVAGTTTFVAGVDYEVRDVGDRTEIRRIAGGGIPDGATVSVEYRFQTAPSLTFLTVRHSLNAGIDYPWVSLYYRHERQDQTLREGAEENAVFLEDLTSHLWGGALRSSGEEIQASATTEYSLFRSSTLSFNLLDLHQEITYVPFSSWGGTLGLSQAFREDVRGGRRTEMYGARLAASWQPLDTARITAFGAVRLRKETDSPRQLDIEGGTEGRWRWRAVEFTASYRYSQQRVAGDSREVHRLTLEVLRRF